MYTWWRRHNRLQWGEKEQVANRRYRVLYHQTRWDTLPQDSHLHGGVNSRHRRHRCLHCTRDILVLAETEATNARLLLRT